jgi:FAD-dependent urate hydroxylase
MSFWEGNMPARMFLRSNWTATQIASPDDSLTLEAFQAATSRRFGTPVPVDQFIAYGKWFQQQAVPHLDRRRICHIESAAGGFAVHLQDGEIIQSRRVVIAAGIAAFARRPSLFSGLPPAIVSHTVDHHDLQAFAGKRVLVVGSGQSALESAALLHEGGAEVEVAGRARQIHWLQGWASKTLHHRMGKLTTRLLYAPTDVGPAGLSQILARPRLVAMLPRGVQDKLRRRATRPAGARWLVDRLRGIPITLGCTIAAVTSSGDNVKVRLGDGTEKIVDHVLLGTGFHIDISKYEFLSPEIAHQIRRSNGFPVLRQGLEASVPGLHFLGAPAAWSSGPLLQFVSGTHFASRSLTRSIAASRAHA